MEKRGHKRRKNITSFDLSQGKVNYSSFRLLSVLLIIAVTLLSVVVYAAVNKSLEWHPENEVYVNVGGFEGTLQQAIDDGLLKGSGAFSVADVSSVSNLGHSFSDIWVSVNGNEKTLKQALSSGDLCGTSSPTTSFLDEADPGHLATEIEVSADGTKSLQDAINDGSIAKVDGGWSGCVDGTRTCTNPAPYCGGADCTGDPTQGCVEYLVNGKHTDFDCEDAGGSVYNSGGTKFCRFYRSSCPSGWSQYQSWSATSQVSAAAVQECENDKLWRATSGYHGFSNQAVEYIKVRQGRYSDDSSLGACTIANSRSCRTTTFGTFCSDYYHYDYSGDGANTWINGKNCFDNANDYNGPQGGCTFAGSGFDHKRSVTQSVHNDFEARSTSPNTIITYVKYASRTQIGCY